jgi:dTDP-glucose 4,6-dehydratase
MKILITGGAGFIGSNFIRLVLRENPDYEIVNLDALTYAGNLENLKEFEAHPRYRFIKGDIRDSSLVNEVMDSGIEAVVNFAAESHVDRSIDDPENFLQTNIMGTAVLLEAARGHQIKCLLQVGTDEVYGSLGPEEVSKEDSPLKPNSPYSASKAAADLLARSYFKTFGLPVVITRSSNNYGPFQFPEKLIPLFITNALEDRPLPLYGDGLNRRDWIHTEDNCRGILLCLEEGRPGETYNIGGDNERTNIEITEMILDLLKKPKSLIRFVKDRPGHDRRYALDSSKIQKELGFEPEHDFAKGIEDTIEWYKQNRDWWRRIKSGEYRDYYEKMYSERIRAGKGLRN